MKKITEKQRERLQYLENNKATLTFAQKLILKRSLEKLNTAQTFQDNWNEYEESYGTDYNDCHGDYYDAEN